MAGAFSMSLRRPHRPPFLAHECKEAMPRKPSTRTKRPSTPESIRPVTRKAQAREPLPGATIYGVLPDSNEYVAWDGEQYVLCQTKDRVLADGSLMLIGSVQELRVDHSHPGRMDRVEVVIPTPQLTNGSRDHGPEPLMGQGNVEVRAKVSENSNDTILSRATAAVSESLLQEVTTSFKRLFRFHYESSDEIAQSPERQEINKLFGAAADTYVSIAMNNRRKIRGDLLLWVKAQIEANETAISTQHFSCDRNGYLSVKKTSKRGLAEHHDNWKAQEHIGWMNHNSVSWVCRENIARAASVALRNAAIRIASGNTGQLQPSNQDTSATRAQSQARSLPIRSSAPLSKFEATVGKLMLRARSSCPTKYLPRAEIVKIAVQLDDKNFPVRDNLEREAARAMAEYNQRHPTSAIKSWRVALSLPQFRRVVRKRFSRAEEKYRKATPSILAPSAGTPRTTI